MTDSRIEKLNDERASGGKYFVYLKPGFQYDGAHCFGERTIGAVKNTMRRVTRCACAECLKLLEAQRPPALTRPARSRKRRHVESYEDRQDDLGESPDY